MVGEARVARSGRWPPWSESRSGRNGAPITTGDEIVLLKMTNDRGRRLPAYVVFRTQRISGGREPTLGRSARRPRGRPASRDPGRPFCFARPCVAKALSGQASSEDQHHPRTSALCATFGLGLSASRSALAGIYRARNSATGSTSNSSDIASVGPVIFWPPASSLQMS
jgi:hypothetical protein